MIFTVCATAQTKLPLTLKDADSWRSISGQTLSRDGKFIAYAYMPQEGDGDLIVRNIATGKEYRQGVGTLPPPGGPPIQKDRRRHRTVRIAAYGNWQYFGAIATSCCNARWN